MDTVMFASGSGGCGKTTLALCTARELVRAGRAVMIAELCCGFGCAGDILGTAEQTAFSLSDILEGRCSLEQAAVQHRSGLRLISAPADYSYIPEREALASLAEQACAVGAQHLIFDCASGFSPVQAAAASLSDIAVLVATPDYISARAAGRASAEIAASGCARRRLIINRVGASLDKASGVADLDEVIDLAGAQLLGVVPEEKGAPRGVLGGDASLAVHNVAGRLLGKSVRLLPLFL